MRRFLYLTAFILIISIVQPTFAADCATKACVDVFTDPQNGGIIITAHQNRSGATPVPKPQPKPRPKPRPRPSVPRALVTHPFPRPTRKVYVAPRPRRTYRPRPKPQPTPTPVSAINLSDRIMQLIPTRHIYSQPSPQALVQVPITFWTDSASNFTTSVVILGIPVSVFLTPTYTWDFGDGKRLTTHSRGGPRPSTDIIHTYTRAGTYTVILSISWSGNWMADQLMYPVLGNAIVQTISMPLTVVAGPTKFTS
jgi:PKD domain